MSSRADGAVYCHSCVAPRRTLCTAPLTSDCAWRQAIISPAPPHSDPTLRPRPYPGPVEAASPAGPARTAAGGHWAPGGERNEGARGREGWDKWVGVVPIPGLTASVAIFAPGDGSAAPGGGPPLLVGGWGPKIASGGGLQRRGVGGGLQIASTSNSSHTLSAPSRWLPTPCRPTRSPPLPRRRFRPTSDPQHTAVHSTSIPHPSSSSMNIRPAAYYYIPIHSPSIPLRRPFHIHSTSIPQHMTYPHPFHIHPRPCIHPHDW